MDVLISNSLFDLIRYRDVPDGDAVVYITSKNFDGGAQLVCDKTSCDVSFYELRVDNWDDNLTPWAVDAKMKGRTFAGRADALLAQVVREVVPVVRANASKLYIAGYSLAGLFSLWALYNCEDLDGCACCSGSLWYPGWVDYAKAHQISSARVYLSVGNREKNSKNEYMKTVEEAYAIEQDLLSSCENVEWHFDLNEGGHFNDVNERVIKGINWLIV